MGELKICDNSLGSRETMSETDFPDHIYSKHADDANIDINLVAEPERTIMCVFHADYFIGNGGFRFLFEGDLIGKTSYKMIVNSYERAGFVNLSKSIQQVLDLFPGGEPHKDLDLRNLFLDKYFEVEDEAGEPIKSYSPIVDNAETLYYLENKKISAQLEQYYDYFLANADKN